MAQVTFLVGGQGGQYFGMGRKLLESAPEFASTMHRADDALHVCTGRRFMPYLYDERRQLADPCDDLTLSSIALVAVQVGLAEVLVSYDVRPSTLVGNSLGEFIALVIAARLPLEDAVAYIAGFTTAAEHRMSAGWMVALIDSGDSDLGQVLDEMDATVIARNGDRHAVVAGVNSAWAETDRIARESGLTVSRLPVNFAFHTAAVAPLAPEVPTLDLTPFQGTDVVRCSTGLTVNGDLLDDAYCTLRGPMHLLESVRGLIGGQHRVIVDLAPGGGQAAILRLAREGKHVFSVMTPFHQEREAAERIAEQVHHG